MTKELKGFSTCSNPYWYHDCDKCQYITSVRMTYLVDDDIPASAVIDIYKQCGDHEGYLIRFGENAEYASGVTLASLAATYIDSHNLGVIGL